MSRLVMTDGNESDGLTRAWPFLSCFAFETNIAREQLSRDGAPCGADKPIPSALFAKGSLWGEPVQRGSFRVELMRIVRAPFFFLTPAGPFLFLLFFGEIMLLCGFSLCRRYAQSSSPTTPQLPWLFPSPSA